MRTSTGSIRVTKIIQKTIFLNGKRKYTMAKADSSEIAILPMLMTSAVTRLIHIMRPTTTRAPWVSAPSRAAL